MQARFIYEYLEHNKISSIFSPKSKEQIEKDLSLLPKEKLNRLLLNAAREGSIDKVKWLLAAGADVEVKDNDGWTALIYASMYGYKEVVQMLLDAGADVEVKDKWGQTALMYASMHERKDVVQALLAAGAKEPIKESFYKSLNELELPPKSKEQIKKDLSLLNKDKLNHMLIDAACEGSLDKVIYLLDAGADVEAKDREYRTPLMYASIYERKDVVKKLLAAGADIEAKDVIKRTSLMWAAFYESKKVLRLLLDAGADVEAEDINGWTALTLASMFFKKQIIQMLKQ
jgi:uncharacterized protein